MTSLNASQISRACALLAQGQPVVFPTETVYGLGANALNDQAVARIYALKNRPTFNPLIVHYPTVEAMEPHVVLSPLARQLAAAFWPGPLTLVLPSRPTSGISSLVRAGGDTLAVRIPRHPLALELLNACPFPLAAPSANRSGFLSPTTALHVAEDLGQSVPLILDGGPCQVGLESTIIDLTSPTPQVLRPGGMDLETLGQLLSLSPFQGSFKGPGGPILKSPGQLESHYAPTHRVYLNASTAAPQEGFLTFGPPPPHEAAAVQHLSLSGDLTEAAANFFPMLHLLDKEKVTCLRVMPIPNQGLGQAINDRLRRQAVERNEAPSQA